MTDTGWRAEADPPPTEAEGEVLFTKSAATFMIPQELLEDMQGFDVSDWLRKALRGEIEPRPPVKPSWHRCVFCWLISWLPGHDRCEHGRLSCDDCFDDR